MAVILYGFYLNDVDMDNLPWEDDVGKWWLKYSNFEFINLIYDGDKFIGHLVSKDVNDKYYATRREHLAKYPLPFEQHINWHTGEIIIYLPTLQISIDRGETVPFAVEELFTVYSEDSLQRIETTKRIMKEFFGDEFVVNYSFYLANDGD